MAQMKVISPEEAERLREPKNGKKDKTESETESETETKTNDKNN